jgi:hypothetical protein
MNTKSTPRQRLLAFLVEGACVVVLCCSPGEARLSDATTVMDSAGVQIVQNSLRLPADAERWMLTASPLFEVPAVNSVGDTLFIVPLNGTVRLSDHTLLAAEAIYDDVRVLGSDGSMEVAVPCSTDVSGVIPYVSDSLLVSDVQFGAIIVDEQFRRGRAFDLAIEEKDIREPLAGMIMAAFDDGTVVAYGRAQPKNPFETKIVRPTFYLLHYSANGSFLNSFGPFFGREALQLHEDDVQAFEFSIPFPVETLWAALGDAVYVGYNDRYEIQVYDSDGSLRRLIRRAWDPVRLSEGDAAIYRERVMTSMRSNMDPDLRASVIDRFIEFPKHKPSFDTLTVDHEGRLWVRELRSSTEPADIWAVFDTTGIAITEVEVPHDLFVTEIGEDYLVGLKGGWWDIETAMLQVFGLEKRAGTLDGA